MIPDDYRSLKHNPHCHPNVSTDNKTTRVFVSKVSSDQDTQLLLDTQAIIHIFRNPAIATDIEATQFPVTFQGITGDKVRITEEGFIRDINIKRYYSPYMAANIISYHKLKETHTIHYNERTDVFIATLNSGPKFTFMCVDGNYVVDLDAVRQAYVVSASSTTSKYSTKQLSAARNAYEFMQRMGHISYKAAAEVVQRGSTNEVSFTRSDLVNAQDIYGTQPKGPSTH